MVSREEKMNWRRSYSIWSNFYILEQYMSYTKDFEGRNIEKQSLESKTSQDFYVNPGEIWYVKLWVNIGFEEDWKREYRRPVLVISRIGSLFFVIPLTSKIKENKYHFRLLSPYFEVTSTAMLSQARVIDKKRFLDKIGWISHEEMMEIQKKLKELYLWAL